MTCRELPLPRAHPSSVTSPAPRIACPGCHWLCSGEAGSEGAIWTSPFFSASRGKIPTCTAGSALPRKELFKRLISLTVTIFRGWAGRWRTAQCPAKEQTQVKTSLPSRPGNGGAAQALDAQPGLQPTPTYQLPVCTGPLPGGLSDPRACPALSPGPAWRSLPRTLGGGSITNIWTQPGSVSWGVLGQV